MPPRKREQVEPNPGHKRYMRRNKLGQFTSAQVDVGRSLTVDRRQPARRVEPPGQGEATGATRRGRPDQSHSSVCPHPGHMVDSATPR